MTTPKVATIKRGGSRFYVHPREKTKVPGVTSVVGMLPKDFLKFWAAKLVAEVAVDNIGAVVNLAMKDPEGAVDYLKRAPMRNTGKAADTGTDVHDLAERIFAGEDIGRVHPDLAPYVLGCREFVTEFEPEFLHLEKTVWSHKYGYAGSFDWIAKIGDEIVLGDTKTTRSGVHADVALQLNAYANADFLIDAEGTETEIPKITGLAVLHLRPEGWKVVPVTLDDDIFQTFLSLLPVLNWERETKKGVIGKEIAGRQFPNTEE